jgi:hypothetical protein
VAATCKVVFHCTCSVTTIEQVLLFAHDVKNSHENGYFLIDVWAEGATILLTELKVGKLNGQY